MSQANILAQLGSKAGPTFRNRIINGAMVIDQRNNGASVTITNTGAITYTLDRWFAYGSVASKFSVQQNAGSVTPPVGFSNYLGCTSASAYSVGAGDVFLIGQSIEGFNTADLNWGTANAKTVTLSFQVYSSLTGTFGGALKNSANNRTYPFSYSIPVANTWTTISITVAGDTSGTWIGSTNGIGIQVSFGLGVGSTGSGTAGAWSSTNYTSVTGAISVVGTNGATFYITGVQLEVGSSATGFEYVNYQTSLANCQRYYTKLSSFVTNGQLAIGISTSTSSAWVQVVAPVAFRASPTINYSGIIITDNVNYSSAVTSIAASAQTLTGAGVAFVSGAVATQYRPAIINTSSSSGYIDFNAEL